MQTQRTRRPKQEGTRDLKRFLGELSARTNHIPRKLRDNWTQGQGGEVFRQMARDEYLAKHRRAGRLSAATDALMAEGA